MPAFANRIETRGFPLVARQERPPSQLPRRAAESPPYNVNHRIATRSSSLITPVNIVISCTIVNTVKAITGVVVA